MLGGTSSKSKSRSIVLKSHHGSRWPISRSIQNCAHPNEEEGAQRRLRIKQRVGARLPNPEEIMMGESEKLWWETVRRRRALLVRGQQGTRLLRRLPGSWVFRNRLGMAGDPASRGMADRAGLRRVRLDEKRAALPIYARSTGAGAPRSNGRVEMRRRLLRR